MILFVCKKEVTNSMNTTLNYKPIKNLLQYEQFR